jgi:hypothetical protein
MPGERDNSQRGGGGRGGRSSITNNTSFLGRMVMNTVHRTMLILTLRVCPMGKFIARLSDGCNIKWHVILIRLMLSKMNWLGL